MKTYTTTIKTPDGDCDTFVAHPSDEAAHPAVLFYMDAFGPRAQLYAMAERIASWGYYVLLPNLFYRVRHAPVVDAKFPASMDQMPELFKEIMPLMEGLPPELALRDAGVFLDFLSKQREVSGIRVGITGYCMGGGLSIRTAAHYPERVAAAASFHGGNLATQSPDSPHLLLDRIRAELYIAHADQDASMPAEQIERLKDALESSGVRYEAELYQGASHGFTMADLPIYQGSASQRHWTKLSKLFERTLGTERA